MQTVSKGRIVMVKLRKDGSPQYYNGEDDHPAIVTAVFADNLINVRVFVDSDVPPIWLESIPNDHEASQDYGGATWYWPPRAEG